MTSGDGFLVRMINVDITSLGIQDGYPADEPTGIFPRLAAAEPLALLPRHAHMRGTLEVD
jgi:hypothetical protein